jgi:hypothetical protein
MKKVRRLTGGAASALVLMAAAGGGGGCGDDDGGDPAVQSGVLEIGGVWSSGFGEETISDSRWDGFCQQAIVSFDNADNVAILKTDGGEGCGTGFGRVIWTDVVGDAFDYCTTTFGEASAQDAETSPTAAITQDLMTGCGGFPWSHLTRK